MNKVFSYEIIKAAGVLLAAFLIWWVLSWITQKYVTKFILKTRTGWDDLLIKHKLLSRALFFVPFAILSLASSYLGKFGFIFKRLVDVGIPIVTALVITSLLNVFNDIYEQKPISKRWPLKGYIQVANLLIFFAAGIVAVCSLLGKSPWALLSGLGALSAVLMLVFRHTILSFVATFQVLSQNLIEVGDWIEMPKYGVDGEVIEISLPNLVVRNWDNTLVVVPSYKLLEDSFKNWRGMQESGGRRIKRAVYIDQTSIKYCDPKMLERLKKVHLLKGYLERKLKEIEEDAKQRGVDLSESPLNGRRLTNIGTFRIYVEEYLKAHPNIRKDMTLMVRQLQPTPQGLPLEVYCFVADTRWVPYEKVQADIFDHILAAMQEFELKVLQVVYRG
ncbi:mechanosensitive ion channel family protein [Thermosulfidibacter takaii]|uniref:mechanosensitive ion channel family protein n=1 Tax=Thermosulfidibacter takaii TaxID=412593 RepID=UPI0018D2E8E2|nr:mechanosensitive ion channel family protein [Thermosulfidibacter takaii]